VEAGQPNLDIPIDPEVLEEIEKERAESFEKRHNNPIFGRAHEDH